VDGEVLSALGRQIGGNGQGSRHRVSGAEGKRDAYPISPVYPAFQRKLLPCFEPSRDFYAELCRVERWSVRTLREKIGSMLYERTALSKKPAELARVELEALRETDRLSPDLVFRDPYLLDFLGLKDTYQEKDLEAAILANIESFLLELGGGFTFVARQKRISLDDDDFYLGFLAQTAENMQ